MRELLNFCLVLNTFKLILFGVVQRHPTHAQGIQETTPMNYTVVVPIPEDYNVDITLWSACGGSFWVEATMDFGNETIYVGAEDVKRYDINPDPSEGIWIRPQSIELGYHRGNGRHIPEHLQTLKGRSIILKSNATLRFHILEFTDRGEETEGAILPLNDRPTAIVFDSIDHRNFDLSISLQRGGVTSGELFRGKVLPNNHGVTYVFLSVFDLPSIRGIVIGGGSRIPFPDNIRESSGSLSLIAKFSTSIGNVRWFTYDIKSYDSYSASTYNCKNIDNQNKIQKGGTGVHFHIIWGVFFLVMFTTFGIFTHWMIMKKKQTRVLESSNTHVMPPVNPRTRLVGNMQSETTQEDPDYAYGDASFFTLPRGPSLPHEVKPAKDVVRNGTPTLPLQCHTQHPRIPLQGQTQLQDAEEEHVYDYVDLKFMSRIPYRGPRPTERLPIPLPDQTQRPKNPQHKPQHQKTKDYLELI